MKEIKKLIKCHNFLIKKSKLSPKLSISDMSGGLIKVAGALLTSLNFDIAYNSPDMTITDTKIIDYCAYNVGRISRMSDDILTFFKYNQIFGNKSVIMYKDSSAPTYFGDEFLSSINSSRRELHNLIVDRDKHPLSKYIYVKYEDKIKQRFHNTNAGFILCKRNTTLWCKDSPVCNECIFIKECKDLLRKRNMELLRLREE